MIKFVDAFAGVGGFHQGVVSAAADLSLSAKCVTAIEWDAACQKTYQSNYGVLPLGDITTVNVEELPDHDVLTGGFPCQSFSQVGKHQIQKKSKSDTVLDDPRTFLYLHLVRILNAKKPAMFLFENVGGWASAVDEDGSPFRNRVIRDLRACGYRVGWAMLNASDYGVPQARKRAYILGIRRDLRADLVEILSDIQKQQIPATRVSVRDLAEEGEHAGLLIRNLWGSRTLKDGSLRVDVLERLLREGGKVIRPGKMNLLAEISGDTPSGKSRQQDRVYSVLGHSPTLICVSPPAFDFAGGVRLPTSRELFRLQGFPETFIPLASYSASYRQAGNAVCVPVVKIILRTAIERLNKQGVFGVSQG